MLARTTSIIVQRTGCCPYSHKLSERWLQKLTSEMKMPPKMIFCVPGGKGRDVLASANRSIVLHNLHSFLTNGGCYVGICCGAYIACNQIQFDDNIFQHGLDVVNAVAIGPKFKVGERYSYTDPNEAVVLQITDSNCSSHTRSTMPAYYRGGGTFVPGSVSRMSTKETHLCEDHAPDYTIEAKYEDGTPCVVSKRYGKGTIILSAIHPEHPESMCDAMFRRILNDLNPSQCARL